MSNEPALKIFPDYDVLFYKEPDVVGPIMYVECKCLVRFEREGKYYLVYCNERTSFHKIGITSEEAIIAATQKFVRACYMVHQFYIADTTVISDFNGEPMCKLDSNQQSEEQRLIQIL